ncbi:ABC transporter permease [Halolamina sp.]|jgi:peptide/nickel transport system permease protein|uniref:ABC transporter permease n=1 Tax=Halolamina sp. TaxID=1940283 RepID=UPI00356364C1
MSFRSFIGRRLVGTFLTFLVVATIIFFLFRQVGSPQALFMSPSMNAEQIARIEAQFGLNEPLYVQYYKYLVSIFTLEFGMSFYYRADAAPLLFNRLKNSLLLTVPAILLSYVAGTLGGVVLAWKRGEPLERAGLVMAILFRSSPRFYVGLLLLFFLSGMFAFFPYGGILPAGETFTSHLELLTRPAFYRHAVLPIVSMSLYLTGLPLMLMRTSMLEVIGEDFVDICRAKGMSESDVMYKHVARNAILPVMTAFAVAIAFSFGGNVLVETVFSYPGVGRLMVNSVFRGDYPVAQFAFLLMAGMVLTMNMVADILYGYLDPRVSYN